MLAKNLIDAREVRVDNGRVTPETRRASRGSQLEAHQVIQSYLPKVLQQPHGNSISLERALKQIKQFLIEIEPETPAREDALQASIDDVETMLGALK